MEEAILYMIYEQKLWIVSQRTEKHKKGTVSKTRLYHTIYLFTPLFILLVPFKPCTCKQCNSYSVSYILSCSSNFPFLYFWGCYQFQRTTALKNWEFLTRKKSSVVCWDHFLPSWNSHWSVFQNIGIQTTRVREAIIDV